MSVLRHILFLDPAKHPYIVVSERGHELVRFSNLPCAARTVTLRSKRKGAKVVTPDGDELDKGMCETIVQSYTTVSRYMNRPVSVLEVMNGTR